MPFHRNVRKITKRSCPSLPICYFCNTCVLDLPVPEGFQLRSDLSRRERQIMEVIYRLGESTANQIVDAMPDDLANATVRTQLRTLEAKGIVKHRRDGKQFIYMPAVPRKSAATKAFRKVLEIFFGGSVEDALATHLADPKTELSDDQVKRLRRLLSEHQTRGGKK